jgi:3-oxoacyl-[acyl-carrier protein] reductase
MAARHVLVTGASRGIGLAVVTRFVEAGWRVSALSRSVISLRGVTSFVCDVSDKSALAEAVRSAGKAQPIDCVVVNAGVDGFCFVDEEVASARFEETLRVNVMAAFHAVAFALPFLATR